MNTFSPYIWSNPLGVPSTALPTLRQRRWPSATSKFGCRRIGCCFSFHSCSAAETPTRRPSPGRKGGGLPAGGQIARELQSEVGIWVGTSCRNGFIFTYPFNYRNAQERQKYTMDNSRDLFVSSKLSQSLWNFDSCLRRKMKRSAKMIWKDHFSMLL